MLQPNLITDMPLDGYCNHVQDFHDGVVGSENPTLYRIVDVEPSVQLWRWRYYARTWELLWDLRAMADYATWKRDRKPGAGHSLCFGTRSLILGICYKSLNPDVSDGVLTVSFLREKLLPFAP